MESNKEINLDDSVFEAYGSVLIRKYDCETLRIEPWGKKVYVYVALSKQNLYIMIGPYCHKKIVKLRLRLKIMKHI